MIAGCAAAVSGRIDGSFVSGIHAVLAMITVFAGGSMIFTVRFMFAVSCIWRCLRDEQTVYFVVLGQLAAW